MAAGKESVVLTQDFSEIFVSTVKDTLALEVDET